MQKKKIYQGLLIASAIFAMVAISWQSVIAQKTTDRVEVQVDFDDYIDISIGNSGVSQEESRYRGLIVMEKYEHPPNYGMGWHIWTQRHMDVRFYDNNGRLFDGVYGIVQVYFDLDPTQRKIWEDRKYTNMSIWHYDIREGRFVKCPTIVSFHLEDYPHGRLSCAITTYGLYALGWTKPTIKMQLTKAAE